MGAKEGGQSHHHDVSLQGRGEGEHCGLDANETLERQLGWRGSGDHSGSKVLSRRGKKERDTSKGRSRTQVSGSRSGR